MGKKFRDRDILRAMAMHLDEDSVVFGANGRYAVGGYYTVMGDDYNNESVINEASGTTAAKDFMTDQGRIDEDLQKAIWLMNY